MTEQLITLRHATAADAAALAEFAERSFRNTYMAFNTPDDMDRYVAGAFSEAIQRAEIDKPAVTCVLAEADGALAGYAQLTTRVTSVGTQVEVDRLYVDIPWHGRGVAQQLMAKVVSIASAAGAQLLVLGVWQENQRAVNFYIRSGFSISGPATFLLGSDLQHDWIMTRTLEQP